MTYDTGGETLAPPASEQEEFPDWDLLRTNFVNPSDHHPPMNSRPGLKTSSNTRIFFSELLHTIIINIMPGKNRASRQAKIEKRREEYKIKLGVSQAQE